MIDPSRLQTVFNYAATRVGRSGKPVTVGYVYRLIKEGKLESVTIDGMAFVVLPATGPPLLP